MGITVLTDATAPIGASPLADTTDYKVRVFLSLSAARGDVKLWKRWIALTKGL